MTRFSKFLWNSSKKGDSSFLLKSPSTISKFYQILPNVTKLAFAGAERILYGRLNENAAISSRGIYELGARMENVVTSILVHSGLKRNKSVEAL